MKIYPNFRAAIDAARQRLIDVGIWVKPDQWQSRDVSSKPEAMTRETLHFSFQVPITGESLPALRKDIGPNLPWADEHFEERVGGQPLNPGVQWANWPWGNSADSFRDNGGKFSHTYMERIWPKRAGEVGEGDRFGIRYRYGDLLDVVAHLAAHPLSRQAYLPIWFPEDTGVVHGERVPCTLGYHFIMRDGFLHTTYYIRSCDIVRHFQDDIYLAVRLKLWLLNQLRERSPVWKKVMPGFLLMHIGSLHAFKNDVHQHVRAGKWE
jgi:thymidylate synthase